MKPSNVKTYIITVGLVSAAPTVFGVTQHSHKQECECNNRSYSKYSGHDLTQFQSISWSTVITVAIQMGTVDLSLDQGEHVQMYF